jgi:hypothetical protein
LGRGHAAEERRMSTTAIERPERMPPPPDDPFYIGRRRILHRDAAGTVVGHEDRPLTEEDYLHPQEEDRFTHNDLHFRMFFYLCHALLFAFRERPRVKLFGRHRIDWQHEGIEPHGPDAAVFNGFDAKPEEYSGTLPVKDVGAEIVAVFEVTSESTRHVDFGRKFEEYAEIGIPYYIVIDAAAPNGTPDVLGFRLRRGEYKLMRRDRELGYQVPELKLWFRMEGDRLILADEDGHDIPGSPEVGFQLEAEKQRAEAEKQRAEAEKTRADSEAARAEALAAELAALKASLPDPTP